jgi:hypothetical protein
MLYCLILKSGFDNTKKLHCIDVTSVPRLLRSFVRLFESPLILRHLDGWLLVVAQQPTLSFLRRNETIWPVAFLVRQSLTTASWSAW